MRTVALLVFLVPTASLAAQDENFDGGATPGGDLGGTWAAPSVDDDSHNHMPAGLYLQKISVNICCPSSGAGTVQGSGTVVLSDTAHGPACWILTAHHVVEDLREVQTVIDSEGNEKKSIRYRDAQVIQEEVHEGWAIGGSSGGLVALQSDGRYIGMITLGLRGGDNFHWIVPIRSIRDWTKEIGAEWLLDPSLPRPTKEDLEAIPLELNAPGFASAPGEAPTPAEQLTTTEYVQLTTDN